MSRPTANRLVSRPVEVHTAPPVEIPAAVPGASPAPPLTLRTPRLLLRPLLESDRGAYLAAAAASRAELDRFLPLHMDGDGAKESDGAMFERQLTLARLGASGARDWVRFVCILGGDGGGREHAIVGGVNLQSISRGLDWRAEINFWIATPFAGRGLGREAVGAVAAHAFADLPRGLGLTELHAWITGDNAKSAALAAALGFRRAGEEKTYLLTDERSWVLHDLWVLRAAAPA